jgi:hypothetical protein
MNKLQLYIISLLNITYISFAQNDLDSLYFYKEQDSLKVKGCFFTLEEARKVNPDSVHFLEIGNSNLSAFPMEVLAYKNLYELNFGSANIAEMYLNERWLLTKYEKEEYTQKSQIDLSNQNL